MGRVFVPAGDDPIDVGQVDQPYGRRRKQETVALGVEGFGLGTIVNRVLTALGRPVQVVGFVALVILVEKAVQAENFPCKKKKRFGVTLLGGLAPAGEEQRFLERVERLVFRFLLCLFGQAKYGEKEEKKKQEERYLFNHDSSVRLFLFYHSFSRLSKIVAF